MSQLVIERIFYTLLDVNSYFQQDAHFKCFCLITMKVPNPNPNETNWMFIKKQDDSVSTYKLLLLLNQ